MTKRRRALACDRERSHVRACSIVILRHRRIGLRRVACVAAPPDVISGKRGALMELEDEETWLRARIIRLRRLLRYVKDPQVEAGLKEFITDAETRLDGLERRRLRPVEDEPPGGWFLKKNGHAALPPDGAIFSHLGKDRRVTGSTTITPRAS